MQGELVRSKPTRRRPFKKFHVFHSQYNEGAEDILSELASLMDKDGKPLQLQSTNNVDELFQCDHILVCVCRLRTASACAWSSQHILTGVAISVLLLAIVARVRTCALQTDIVACGGGRFI